jgi:hypothetical protein
MGNVITRNSALLALALPPALALGTMAKYAYDISLTVTWLTGS